MITIHYNLKSVQHKIKTRAPLFRKARVLRTRPVNYRLAALYQAQHTVPRPTFGLRLDLVGGQLRLHAQEDGLQDRFVVLLPQLTPLELVELHAGELQVPGAGLGERVGVAEQANVRGDDLIPQAFAARDHPSQGLR